MFDGRRPSSLPFHESHARPPSPSHTPLHHSSHYPYPHSRSRSHPPLHLNVNSALPRSHPRPPPSVNSIPHNRSSAKPAPAPSNSARMPNHSASKPGPSTHTHPRPGPPHKSLPHNASTHTRLNGYNETHSRSHPRHSSYHHHHPIRSPTPPSPSSSHSSRHYISPHAVPPPPPLGLSSMPHPPPPPPLPPPPPPPPPLPSRMVSPRSSPSMRFCSNPAVSHLPTSPNSLQIMKQRHSSRNRQSYPPSSGNTGRKTRFDVRPKLLPRSYQTSAIPPKSAHLRNSNPVMSPSHPHFVPHSHPLSPSPIPARYDSDCPPFDMNRTLFVHNVPPSVSVGQIQHSLLNFYPEYVQVYTEGTLYVSFHTPEHRDIALAEGYVTVSNSLSLLMTTSPRPGNMYETHSAPPSHSQYRYEKSLTSSSFTHAERSEPRRRPSSPCPRRKDPQPASLHSSVPNKDARQKRERVGSSAISQERRVGRESTFETRADVEKSAFTQGSISRESRPRNDSPRRNALVKVPERRPSNTPIDKEKSKMSAVQNEDTKVVRERSGKSQPSASNDVSNTKFVRERSGIAQPSAPTSARRGSDPISQDMDYLALFESIFRQIKVDATKRFSKRERGTATREVIRHFEDKKRADIRKRNPAPPRSLSIVADRQVDGRSSTEKTHQPPAETGEEANRNSSSMFHLNEYLNRPDHVPSMNRSSRTSKGKHGSRSSRRPRLLGSDSERLEFTASDGKEGVAASSDSIPSGFGENARGAEHEQNRKADRRLEKRSPESVKDTAGAEVTGEERRADEKAKQNSTAEKAKSKARQSDAGHDRACEILDPELRIDMETEDDGMDSDRNDGRDPVGTSMSKSVGRDMSKKHPKEKRRSQPEFLDRGLRIDSDVEANLDDASSLDNYLNCKRSGRITDIPVLTSMKEKPRISQTGGISKKRHHKNGLKHVRLDSQPEIESLKDDMEVEVVSTTPARRTKRRSKLSLKAKASADALAVDPMADGKVSFALLDPELDSEESEDEEDDKSELNSRNAEDDHDECHESIDAVQGRLKKLPEMKDAKLKSAKRSAGDNDGYDGGDASGDIIDSLALDDGEMSNDVEDSTRLKQTILLKLRIRPPKSYQSKGEHANAPPNPRQINGGSTDGTGSGHTSQIIVEGLDNSGQDDGSNATTSAECEHSTESGVGESKAVTHDRHRSRGSKRKASEMVDGQVVRKKKKSKRKKSKRRRKDKSSDRDVIEGVVEIVGSEEPDVVSKAVPVRNELGQPVDVEDALHVHPDANDDKAETSVKPEQGQKQTEILPKPKKSRKRRTRMDWGSKKKKRKGTDVRTRAKADEGNGEVAKKAKGQQDEDILVIAPRKKKLSELTGWEYVRAQIAALSPEEKTEMSEREGKCARTMLYDRVANKRKMKMSEEELRALVRPQESLNCVVSAGASARANRQQRRCFRKGMSQLNTKSQVLTVSELQQRRKRVYFRKSAIHGMGLYALEDIDANEFVIEYIGAVIRRSIADVREKVYEREGVGDNYLFRINADLVIDATRRGGPARFINHSCDPNLMAKIISIGDNNHIVFYSKRRIEKFHELTYDYKFDIEGDDQKIPCLCNSQNCRKYLN